MNRFRGKYFKPLMAVLAVCLFLSVSFMQGKLYQARDKLGLTRLDPLENAPPMLAFTTIALGGFRGLIANALWVRAMDMQDQGKYFEMAQLANWITTLQPHMTSVWVVQAWNMAYNISIKFQDPRDRWFWVNQGIQLLRDKGLRYNPQEPLIYRELAWFFQHKMGDNLDDAHIFFKRTWADQMSKLFEAGRPDYDTLLDPKTDQAAAKLNALTGQYKMDPKKMKAVDDQYGPLDWRLPESHAIYWACVGLENAKKEELITLRRAVYQSMQMAFRRGRLIKSKFQDVFELGPNLEMVENASKAYETMMEQDLEMQDHIKVAHRNFLRDAVYFLYTQNRIAEANRWFDYFARKYPDQTLISNKPDAKPGTMTLEEYAIARVTEDVEGTSVDRTKAVLEGLLIHSYINRALGIDDQAVNYDLLAQKVYIKFQTEIEGAENRIGLPPLNRIREDVLGMLLSPESTLSPEFQARLRTELGLPAPTNAPPATASGAS